ncbi:MAG: tRNA (guanosine(37)-N1)-methyltransferase TrmD [Eubacterium sp.]|nr:tRNA (guanosine(37)-N1)-methyltransferase TrmD [Eubacterium sp.]MEE3398533.1 tRNA (guanosine(37)-N1)-methyltransferase TrmD [Eubacterium sp.]
MNYHVMTLFPELIEQTVDHSITGRALKSGVISLNAVNMRDFSQNKTKHVDDYIYGGGSGMLIQAEPVWLCYQDLIKKVGIKNTRVLYMSPRGKTFNQSIANALAHNDNIIFICGHYEGIDERAIELINPVHMSIGDFVLTGGELPAILMMDAITRQIPGALGSDDSAIDESFYNGLLEYPQYTRPPVYEGLSVPDVLLSGNHKKINEYRQQKALEITKEYRPDMYEKYIKSVRNT